ncbi:PAS domain S-box protein, partial [bacterium]|nr:PAS domain S-box protein [bacterium]NIO73292.1 PAS domain S-box protein [bacterium]
MAEEDAQAQDLRKKYEIIVENIGEGLVTYNRNMIVTFANDKLSKILGYNKDEI